MSFLLKNYDLKQNDLKILLGPVYNQSKIITFQWRNQTTQNFKFNVLTIITFDRSDGFQSDKIHFKA